jgi:ribulose 1,5-bisphosphate carboxylase large subunit-like protein
MTDEQHDENKEYEMGITADLDELMRDETYF